MFSSQNRIEKAEKERIKIIVPFHSYPTRNRKLQKNSKKIKKYHFGFFSRQTRMEKTEKERKQKLTFRYVITCRVVENFNKIANKLRNTITASFQAKLGWKRQRKRENKDYRSVSFLPYA